MLLRWEVARLRGVNKYNIPQVTSRGPVTVKGTCTPTIKSSTTAVLIFARAGKELECMNSASP